jgi:phosphoserine phosphatase
VTEGMSRADYLLVQETQRALRNLAEWLRPVVSRYFDEHDKVRFVEEWCAQNRYSMSRVAAIGASRSDVPPSKASGAAISASVITYKNTL